MGKGISTAKGRLNLGTEVPYEGSPPLHVEVMAKLDQPNISEPFRQRSNSQNHCAEVLNRVHFENHGLSARNQEMPPFAAPQVWIARLPFPKWPRFSGSPASKCAIPLGGDCAG